MIDCGHSGLLIDPITIQGRYFFVPFPSSLLMLATAQIAQKSIGNDLKYRYFMFCAVLPSNSLLFAVVLSGMLPGFLFFPPGDPETGKTNHPDMWTRGHYTHPRCCCPLSNEPETDAFCLSLSLYLCLFVCMSLATGPNVNRNKM